jgi:hypothetical protein
MGIHGEKNWFFLLLLLNFGKINFSKFSISQKKQILKEKNPI